MCVVCVCVCLCRSSTLTFPTSTDQLRELAAALQQLKEDHFYGVLGLFAAAYLYKQCFAIPGSFFMVNKIKIAQDGCGKDGFDVSRLRIL